MSGAPNTLFVGQTILRLERIHSTNQYMVDMVREATLPEGLVVVAREQTAGRGQRGTHWESVAGKNLTFSLFLRPNFLKPDQQFYLSKAVALSLTSVVQRHVEGAVRLKWPNDVLVNGRKIAGILIENQHRGNEWSSVVGIGLNVNQRLFNTINSATSLAAQSGESFDLEALLHELCQQLEAGYMQLRQRANALDERYLHLLHGLGERWCFETDDGPLWGKIVGVSVLGKLQVQNDAGIIREFGLKEIVFPSNDITS